MNVDLQNAYTRPAEFPTAYQTDPRQIEYVNGLARRMRTHGCPVIWTFVAYLDSGEDCGVWGTRADLSRSLRSITAEDRRSRLDDRCDIDRERDIVMNKRMASAFFETNLGSLLTSSGRHGDRHWRLDVGLRARTTWSTASRAASARSFRRSASPTSMRARISPTSTT